MANLPKQLPWSQATNQWPAILNPIIANPLVNGRQIDKIVLKANTPLIVDHSLGQLPQGFIQVDQNAGVLAYRTQPFNVKTITLEATANVTISIWVF